MYKYLGTYTRAIIEHHLRNRKTWKILVSAGRFHVRYHQPIFPDGAHVIRKFS